MTRAGLGWLVVTGILGGCGEPPSGTARNTDGSSTPDSGAGLDAALDAGVDASSDGSNTDGGITLAPISRPLWLGYFKVAGRYGDYTLVATANAGNTACVFANHGDSLGALGDVGVREQLGSPPTNSFPAISRRSSRASARIAHQLRGAA